MAAPISEGSHTIFLFWSFWLAGYQPVAKSVSPRAFRLMLFWRLLGTHSGQFVHVKVAVKAPREFLQDPGRMNVLVALGALRNVAVFVMVALCAKYLGVFARGCLPLGVDLGMTGTAGSCRLICLVSDHLRFVDRVTYFAGCVFLALIMRLVAHGTRGFETVRGVAFRAPKQGMLAWKFHKVSLWLGMAGRAGVGEPAGHGDLARRVRVGVA